VKYAEASGAHRLMIRTPDEILPTLKAAMAMQGPVIVSVPVDYRDNHQLMERLHPNFLH
jgi:acetolactate synthase I/II/III large subunit